MTLNVENLQIPKDNLKLYINEGLLWLKKKYNFNSKWDMSLHVKNYYDKFFFKNKKLKKYKI